MSFRKAIVLAAALISTSLSACSDGSESSGPRTVVAEVEPECVALPPGDLPPFVPPAASFPGLEVRVIAQVAEGTGPSEVRRLVADAGYASLIANTYGEPPPGLFFFWGAGEPSTKQLTDLMAFLEASPEVVEIFGVSCRE